MRITQYLGEPRELTEVTTETLDLSRGGTLLTATEVEAQAWVTERLAQRQYNYFTGFRNAPDLTYGVMFGWAVWAGERPYVKDVFPHVIH